MSAGSSPEGTDGLATPGFRKDPETGAGEDGCPYDLMRWSRFRNEKPERMFEIVESHVFPFIRTLGGAESAMAAHMKGARLAFTRPALLDELVQGLDAIPMDDRDTKGDVYEYLLSMIATAGENGQFRTPRHMIDLIIDHLTKSGTMDPGLLYASPYTDELPNGVSDLFDEKQTQDLVDAIVSFKPRYAHGA